MSLLKLRYWPDPCLSQTCERVAEAEDVSALAQDMLDTMYDAPGRGLAAPQVGIMKRLFVMDCTWKEGTGTPLVCINPEIIETSVEQNTGQEGCLSIPELPVDVTRPAEVTLRWRDLSGQTQEQHLSGFEAKCAQHELDHLNGVVLFDHMSAAVRAELEPTYLERLT
ncbi:MAG: peptide deformylase [Thalassovita sp.]